MALLQIIVIIGSVRRILWENVNANSVYGHVSVKHAWVKEDKCEFSCSL